MVAQEIVKLVDCPVVLDADALLEKVIDFAANAVRTRERRLSPYGGIYAHCKAFGYQIGD